MSKTTKTLHGSCGEVFVNGVRRPMATKIEVKITGNFTDQDVCGDYATYPIYNGYSIEGSIEELKTDSELELAIVKGYETGVMPDILLMTSLRNPATKKTERWSVSGVVFTEADLANIEAKNPVSQSLPFKAEKVTNLEAIR